MKRNCIYHAGCPDGFGAAWAAWRAWGDSARYIPRGHDDDFDPRKFTDELVVFADISLRNEFLRPLSETAGQVVILDHHVSARDNFASDPELGRAMVAEGHTVHFDLEHSGAILSWQHFHPGEPPPDLLRYVEDQDLWNWKLPRSDEVNAAIGSHAREFEAWETLASRSASEIADEGTPIMRAQRMEVTRSLQSAHPIALGSKRIEAVNSPHNRAAIGHQLVKRASYGQPWGLVYRISAKRVDCSIYSEGDLDISVIAGQHGGGGHRNAAGFNVSLESWLRDFA